MPSEEGDNNNSYVIGFFYKYCPKKRLLINSLDSFTNLVDQRVVESWWLAKSLDSYGTMPSEEGDNNNS
jgi:hypothetical protein